MGLAGHQHTDAVIYLGRKNKSFGRAEWQTNFYFRRYLEARRAKKQNDIATRRHWIRFSPGHVIQLSLEFRDGSCERLAKSMWPFASIVTSATSLHPITFFKLSK